MLGRPIVSQGLPILATTIASVAASVMETVVAPVNVFLTGVPPAVNMTDGERQAFEKLLITLLTSRLYAVGLDVLDLVTVSQQPNPDFAPALSAPGVALPALRVATEVTIEYRPPPPAAVRDWSVYLRSWIQSFGTTMVEIFSDPEHPQRPEIDSAFFDGLVDVSATSVARPNTEPTAAPIVMTSAPTYLVYPDNSRKAGIVAGVAVGAALIAAGVFGVWCWMFRLRPERRESWADRSAGACSADDRSSSSASPALGDASSMKSDGGSDGSCGGLQVGSKERRKRKEKRNRAREEKRRDSSEGDHQSDGGSDRSGSGIHDSSEQSDSVGLETSRLDEKRKKGKKTKKKKKKGRSEGDLNDSPAEELESSRLLSEGDSDDSERERERRKKRKREKRRERKRERERQEKDDIV